MNLVIKYSPETCEEVVGREKEISIIKKFLKDFPNVKKKALLLHGPPGAGKTCVVRAVSNDLGFELLEINASDKRNAENIKNIIGSASKQASLFSKKRVILIDELEGIHGRTDRGGVKEIISIIKETSFPIIMVANNVYNKKLSTLRKKARMVEVKKIKYWSVYNLLKNISIKEGISLSSSGLRKLASLSNGDARSALNDLSSIESDEDLEGLYEREKEENIFQVLKMVFKASAEETSLSSTDRLRNMNFNTLLLWIGENIINEYKKPGEVHKAYEHISNSDVFLGRIYRRNHWRFLWYAKLLMTLGVSFSKESVYRKFTRYEHPVKINKLFRSKSKRYLLDSISEKLGRHVHCSSDKVKKHYMHHMRIWKKVSGVELSDKEEDFLK